MSIISRGSVPNGKHLEQALFIVGEPGSGKTTLVRHLLNMSTRGELPMGSCLIPKPKWTMVPTDNFFNVAAAGHYTGQAFDGADSVPYNGVGEALAYITSRIEELGLLIFDGDRFSNAGVLAQLRLMGIGDFRCVHLHMPEVIGQLRREGRVAQHGGKVQNPSWVKGRITKSARFAELFDRRLTLNAQETTPGGMHREVTAFIKRKYEG